MSAKKFAFDSPDAALEAIASRLSVSETVSVASDESTSDHLTGRVLGQTIVADRDSPAADVSAMDGYAVRMSDFDLKGPIEVHAEIACGSPATELAGNGVTRIFTGAIVPSNCDAVIKREDTVESAGSIEIKPDCKDQYLGANIRRQGENTASGDSVIQPGRVINNAITAALANFGYSAVDVHRPARVAIITTGNEVIPVDQTPQAWQLRNSNSASLQATLTPHAWIENTHRVHCRDQKETLAETLTSCLCEADAVVLTGGVSMGDYDYVPDVVSESGGEIIFHGLPIRPGKPILGAATDDGKLIIGLPGNPVSATVNATRMVVPLLAKMSGQSDWMPNPEYVQVIDSPDRTLPLHWLRLVQRDTQPGHVRLVATKGSGDLVSLSQSDGFIEVPPGKSGPGPWPFYRWPSC